MLFQTLPYSVMPLWLLLIIIIPIIIITIYLRYNNLKRKFFLLIEININSIKIRNIISNILTNRVYLPSIINIIEIHGQFQTILQFLLRRLSYYYKRIFNLKCIYYKREELYLSDGGLIALDWGYYIKDKKYIFNSESNNLVILQHGLGGDSKSEYIVHLAEKFLDSSYQVVSIVSRGCGGLKITTPTFVPRKTNDIREIIQSIKLSHPNVRNIYFIGFSLGAAMTIKYCHEEGKKCPLKAAVAISPPWNMAVETMVFPMWSRFIVKVLHHYLKKHQNILTNCNVKYEDVLKTSNLKELDQLLIRFYGYKSIEEYYKDNSAIYYTKNIEIPTLVISSDDDPICAIPENHPTVANDMIGNGMCFIKTSTGGHCAYPQGLLSFTDSWVDGVILDWVKAHD